MSVFPAHSETYDAIVLGGGPGALIAACYLARGGARTLYIGEHNAVADGMEIPLLDDGRRGPMEAQAPYAIDARAMRELQLSSYGLSFAPVDIDRVALHPGGRHLLLPRSGFRAWRAVHRFAPQDGKAYLNYRREMAALARRLQPVWNPEAPPAGEDTSSVLLRMNDRMASKFETVKRMSAAA